jgi:hypothetical protein
MPDPAQRSRPSPGRSSQEDTPSRDRARYVQTRGCSPCDRRSGCAMPSVHRQSEPSSSGMVAHRRKVPAGPLNVTATAALPRTAASRPPGHPGGARRRLRPLPAPTRVGPRHAGASRPRPSRAPRRSESLRAPATAGAGEPRRGPSRSVQRCVDPSLSGPGPTPVPPVGGRPGGARPPARPGPARPGRIQCTGRASQGGACAALCFRPAALRGRARGQRAARSRTCGRGGIESRSSCLCRVGNSGSWAMAPWKPEEVAGDAPSESIGHLPATPSQNLPWTRSALSAVV